MLRHKQLITLRQRFEERQPLWDPASTMQEQYSRPPPGSV